MPQELLFVDLFAGIGGFRVALESLGCRCVASAEIMPQAISVYRKNWPLDPDDHNLGDITKLDILPVHDVLVGGVPCQPWSIAGQNKGFEDPRGQLWQDVIRLVSVNKPRAFIFENVKGLIDPRNKPCLDLIVDSLAGSGYQVQYKLLNAYDFGVPQNRDRVFIVGVRTDQAIRPFVFPRGEECRVRLKDVFDELPEPSTRHAFQIERDLFGERVGVGYNKLTPRHARNDFFVLNDIRHGPTSLHSWDILNATERQRMICLTILKNRRKPQYGPWDGNPMSFVDLRLLIDDLAEEELQHLCEMNILRQEDDMRYEFRHRRLSGGIDGVYRIFLPSARFFSTLTARGMKDAVALENVEGTTDSEYREQFVRRVLKPRRFRFISPREAARLQGFRDEFRLHDRTNHSLMLLGNSVAVPVVTAVARSVVEILQGGLAQDRRPSDAVSRTA